MEISRLVKGAVSQSAKKAGDKFQSASWDLSRALQKKYENLHLLGSK